MPANEPASLLDYSPLHATPLSACIKLKWSYHVHIILLSKNEAKPSPLTLVIETVDALL